MLPYAVLVPPFPTREPALDNHCRAASAAAQVRGRREHIKASWGSWVATSDQDLGKASLKHFGLAPARAEAGPCCFQPPPAPNHETLT